VKVGEVKDGVSVWCGGVLDRGEGGWVLGWGFLVSEVAF
jgi:hypothetical protein